MGSIPIGVIHLRAGLILYRKFQQRISPFLLLQLPLPGSCHQCAPWNYLGCFCSVILLSQRILGWLKSTMRSRFGKYNASFFSWKTSTMTMPTSISSLIPTHYLLACSTTVPRQSFLHSHSCHKGQLPFPTVLLFAVEVTQEPFYWLYIIKKSPYF